MALVGEPSERGETASNTTVPITTRSIVSVLVDPRVVVLHFDGSKSVRGFRVAREEPHVSVRPPGPPERGERDRELLATGRVGGHNPSSPRNRSTSTRAPSTAGPT
jgi:hypothetical protein